MVSCACRVLTSNTKLPEFDCSMYCWVGDNSQLSVAVEDVFRESSKDMERTFFERPRSAGATVNV